MAVAEGSSGAVAACQAEVKAVEAMVLKGEARKEAYRAVVETELRGAPMADAAGIEAAKMAAPMVVCKVVQETERWGEAMEDATERMVKMGGDWVAVCWVAPEKVGAEVAREEKLEKAREAVEVGLKVAAAAAKEAQEVVLRT